MDFYHYLGKMRALYMEGVSSNFHPALLKDFGGIMKVAGHDADEVRIHKDKYLGFIDVVRGPQERYNMAIRKWAIHQKRLIDLLKKGNSPTNAVYTYLRKFGAYPHKKNQMSSMLQKQMMGDGRVYSAWMVPTIRFRQRWRKGSAVMKDTFGAIATMTALFITAEDWTKATPKEWDKALNVGQIGVLVGNMMGAHAGAHTQRMDTHYEASRRTR